MFQLSIDNINKKAAPCRSRLKKLVITKGIGSLIFVESNHYTSYIKIAQLRRWWANLPVGRPERMT